MLADFAENFAAVRQLAIDNSAVAVVAAGIFAVEAAGVEVEVEVVRAGN